MSPGQPHRRFTVEETGQTSYGDTRYGIRFNPPPRRNETGEIVAHSLSFIALEASEFLGHPEETLTAIAQILEEHLET